MKTITVTPYQSYNYGGTLQAYALQRFQRSLGIENELLRLPVFDKRVRRKTFDFKNPRTYLFLLYAKLNAFLFRKEAASLQRKFASFVSAHLKSTRLIETEEELFRHPPEADCYITGSDQVFALRNPQAFARLLGWTPPGKYRCSYAASLGEYDWSPEERKRFSAVLEGFDAISVRETYAQNLLRPLTGKEVQEHLDPVLLLSPGDYDAVSAPVRREKPYVLVYPLLHNPDMQELIDKTRERLGMEIVSVRDGRFNRYKCDHYVPDAGPAEFLGLLRGAEAVLTTSFHGTAFACLFNKPFYVLTKNYKSQRITDLLEHFGLSDRLYKSGMAVDFSVDFRLANAAMEAGRRQAKAYFERMAAACGGGR